MTWSGPIRSVPDLMGPDSPGAMPYGGTSFPTPLALVGTTGAISLPNRPSTAANTPTLFLATFSGAITGNVTLTFPVPHSPTIAGDYLPGDVVRVLVTPASVAAHTLAVVDGGTGTPTLATMPSTLTSGGAIQAQLNAAGTHWTLTDQGGF
jgi:hypothetical protein